MHDTVTKGFNKRIFTFKLFVNDLFFLLLRFPGIIAAVFFSREIDKKFREKILTVVTAINGCRYCAWFHSKVAVMSGMSEQEVVEIMNMQFDTHTKENELTALLYAQHYAETNRNADRVMEEKLFAYYGDKTAKQIKLLIRVMFFANLQGNTFDAFISRVKGMPAANSSVVFEFLFFIINIPFLVPLIPFVKK